MESKIKFVIANTLDNVRLVGLATNSISSLRFDSLQDCAFIETAIVEACTNVVEHAYEFNPDKNMEIDIELKSNQIIFIITDEGHSFDPCQAKPFEFDPNDIENLPEGGMGICILNTIMDEIQYVTRDGKNHLKLIKHVPQTN